MGMLSNDPDPIVKPGKSRTKQSFRTAVDINKIVARYRKTGFMEYVNKNPGMYTDVSSAKTFQESLDIVNATQRLFDALPAVVRVRFNHKPASMVAFLSDEANREEAIKLGMIPKPKKEPKPETVEVPVPVSKVVSKDVVNETPPK